eukprot:GHVS01035378.1.p1 GENE.GHVS01035378.1~~GHVS01035378.1.p1  ORF type:complete len:820 (+),score=142.85 GHVS01035378.1:389-2848(+)
MKLLFCLPVVVLMKMVVCCSSCLVLFAVVSLISTNTNMVVAADTTTTTSESVCSPNGMPAVPVGQLTTGQTVEVADEVSTTTKALVRPLPDVLLTSDMESSATVVGCVVDGFADVVSDMAFRLEKQQKGLSTDTVDQIVKAVFDKFNPTLQSPFFNAKVVEAQDSSKNVLEEVTEDINEYKADVERFNELQQFQYNRGVLRIRSQSENGTTATTAVKAPLPQRRRRRSTNDENKNAVPYPAMWSLNYLARFKSPAENWWQNKYDRDVQLGYALKHLLMFQQYNKLYSVFHSHLLEHLEKSQFGSGFMEFKFLYVPVGTVTANKVHRGYDLFRDGLAPLFGKERSTIDERLNQVDGSNGSTVVTTKTVPPSSPSTTSLTTTPSETTRPTTTTTQGPSSDTSTPTSELSDDTAVAAVVSRRNAVVMTATDERSPSSCSLNSVKCLLSKALEDHKNEMTIITKRLSEKEEVLTTLSRLSFDDTSKLLWSIKLRVAQLLDAEIMSLPRGVSSADATSSAPPITQTPAPPTPAAPPTLAKEETKVLSRWARTTKTLKYQFLSIIGRRHSKKEKPSESPPDNLSPVNLSQSETAAEWMKQFDLPCKPLEPSSQAISKANVSTTDSCPARSSGGGNLIWAGLSTDGEVCQLLTLSCEIVMNHPYLSYLHDRADKPAEEAHPLGGEVGMSEQQSQKSLPSVLRDIQASFDDLRGRAKTTIEKWSTDTTNHVVERSRLLLDHLEIYKKLNIVWHEAARYCLMLPANIAEKLKADIKQSIRANISYVDIGSSLCKIKDNNISVSPRLDASYQWPNSDLPVVRVNDSLFG